MGICLIDAIVLGAVENLFFIAHNVSGICEGRASRHYRFKHPQKLIEKLMLNICTSPLLLQIPCYQQ